MTITKHLDVTGIRGFFRKIVDGIDTEVFIMEHFSTIDMSDQFSFYFNKYKDFNINYIALFHFVMVVKTVFMKNSPSIYNNVLKEIKVRKLNIGKRIIAEVEYVYE